MGSWEMELEILGLDWYSPLINSSIHLWFCSCKPTVGFALSLPFPCHLQLASPKRLSTSSHTLMLPASLASIFLACLDAEGR
jgi:hypothetical protein